MTINLATLKAELSSHVGKSDSEVAAALNVKSIATDAETSREAIQRTLLVRGIVGKINARIHAIRALVLSTMRLSATPSLSDTSGLEARLAALENAHNAFTLLPTIRMDVGAVKSFVISTLDGLITEGVLTNADKAALLLVGRGTISRGEEMFGTGTVIYPGHVARARKA